MRQRGVAQSGGARSGLAATPGRRCRHGPCPDGHRREESRRATMDKKNQQMSAWYFIATITILILLMQNFLVPATVETIGYGQFKSLLKNGRIAEVVVGENTIRGMLKPE